MPEVEHGAQDNQDQQQSKGKEEQKSDSQMELESEAAESAAAEAEEPAPTAAGPFDPKDLAAHVGHGVQIKLANGRRYYGTVERVDARSVSIKIGGRSGNSASLSFLRENIASAESLGW